MPRTCSATAPRKRAFELTDRPILARRAVGAVGGVLGERELGDVARQRGLGDGHPRAEPFTLLLAGDGLAPDDSRINPCRNAFMRTPILLGSTAIFVCIKNTDNE